MRLFHRLREAKTRGDDPSQPDRKVFPSGIKELHCPPLGSTVDIVFIHGLTGDRERTWTAENASEPWPKTLLASKLPTARILTFGYDAYVTDWKSVVSQNRIANHSLNLLTSLAHYREGKEDTNEHPIIFVCHSLGGLVCQDALSNARQRTERRFQSILRSARGIVFLGTPHHGASLAVWAERLSMYIGVVKQTNSKILGVLREDSEVLARVQDGFHIMIQARSQERLQSIKISCFYEELPLAGVGVVVPQHSAIIPGYISIGIRSNHMGMCRFETADDPGFVSIYGELHEWIREIGVTGTSQEITSASGAIGGSQNASVGQDKEESTVPPFIVPYPKNPQFVGRSELLKQLKSWLSHREPRTNDQPHRRVALCGLGGIGKTQIALAYVFWLNGASSDISVFWVHASSIDRFRQAYADIAEKCQVPGYNDPKADVLSLLKRWLEQKDRGRWLMVIDNADDPQLFCRPAELTDADGKKYLGRYIPECAHGAVLITTRNKQVGLQLTKGMGMSLLQIDKMNDDECSQLLRASLGGSLITDAELSTLACRLEQLPLALAQASAFIQENTITVGTYLQLLDRGDQSFVSLLSEEFATVGRDSDTPHALATTWILSFEQIEQQNPLASELLLLMSLFDRQAIPLEFLSDFCESHQSYPQREDLLLIKALGVLKAYSLINEEQGHNYNMHRLVQLVAQKWLATKETMRQFAEKAILTVSHCYPFGQYETREKCTAYLPHVQAVLQLDGVRSSDETIARASILHRAAGLFYFQGQWDLAEKFGTQARDLQREVLGLDHHGTLAGMSNLALTYKKQGKLEEAELLEAQVLKASKATLGLDHPDTLTSINNLASTYKKQGKLEEAELLEAQVLKACKATLGLDHPDTLASMGNLALTYGGQRKLEEAESLGAQVVEACKATLGLDHPNTLTSMGNLASMYQEQGKLEEAELLGAQVVEARKATLGLDHPDTLASMGNLASTYQEQGKLEEAELLGAQVVEARKATLGLDHPYTLTSINNLACIWKSQGRAHDAIQLMENCVEGQRRVLGQDHPHTLDSLDSLNKWRAEESAAVP
ncbi:hypothetical protein F5B21DRAFT_502584 [Xylaria acuta]|nr:hypothetical protein F5B21DRAFT_502584 [Xylaria acuta]